MKFILFIKILINSTNQMFIYLFYLIIFYLIYVFKNDQLRINILYLILIIFSIILSIIKLSEFMWKYSTKNQNNNKII